MISFFFNNECPFCKSSINSSSCKNCNIHMVISRTSKPNIIRRIKFYSNDKPYHIFTFSNYIADEKYKVLSTYIPDFNSLEELIEIIKVLTLFQ